VAHLGTLEIFEILDSYPANASMMEINDAAQKLELDPWTGLLFA